MNPNGKKFAGPSQSLLAIFMNVRLLSLIIKKSLKSTLPVYLDICLYKSISFSSNPNKVLAPKLFINFEPSDKFQNDLKPSYKSTTSEKLKNPLVSKSAKPNIF